MSEPKPAMLLAEYGSSAEVVHAAEKVRDAGYQNWDVHTPFPVHGMDAAMGLGQSKLGWICFFAGLTGTATAFAMIMYMNGYDYPIIVGGKPADAFLSQVPILFELTILFTGLSALIGMLALNEIPRHHHPIFWSKRFHACSDDKFFVSIEAKDPKFDLGRTRSLLDATRPSHVELVEEGT